MSAAPSRRPALLALLLLALLAVGAYWPGLSGHFVFDDFPNIVQNPAVHATSLDAASMARAAGAYQPGPIGRPLATLSFAIDHAFWGLDARGYKRTNLALHVLNTGLVFAFVLALLRLGGRARHALWAGAAVAAAWAVHPLQVSTVLYVVQRMEMLVATSLLLALLAYVAGRRRQIEGRRGGWRGLAASALLAATGLLSKESAVIFPLFALALELTVLGFRAAAARDAALLRVGFGLGVLAGVVAFVGVLLPHYADPAQYAYREFSLGGRLLSQLWILPMYLGQILLPNPAWMLFNYDHLSAPTGLLSPPVTLAGGVFLATLLCAAVALRRRVPLLALGLLWFFAAHALTSNVVPLELAYEHRNYLALLGVLLAAYAAIERVARPHAQALIGGLAVALLIFLCLLRSAAWGSALSLAVENAGNNPLSARASNDLGIEYAELARYDPASPWFARAVAEFERGMALPHASPLPEQALIVLHAAHQLPVDPTWWDSIDAKLQHRTIGVQEGLAMSGLLDRAREGIAIDPARLERAWRLLDARRPWPAHQRARFADWLSRQRGRRADAIAEFEKAAAAADPSLRDRIREAMARPPVESAVAH